MNDSGIDVEIGVVPPEDVNGPYSLLTLDEVCLAHDLAGDEALLFVAQCGPAGKERFRVFNKETKRELGNLPVPSRGIVNPFKFRLESYQNLPNGGTKGKISAMDGVYPKLVGTWDSAILKYEYAYVGADGLEVKLVEEHIIPSNTVPVEELSQGSPPDGAGYPTGYDFFDENTIIITDCFLGIIWTYDVRTKTMRHDFSGPQWFPPVWPDDLNITLPDGTISDGYTGWTHKNREELVQFMHRLPPSALPSGKPMIPGLHGMTLYKNGSTTKVVFVSVGFPGIYAIDTTELFRTDVPPHEKQYETVVPPIRGVASWVAEVQADVFNPGSPWVYFHRTMSNSNEPATKGYEEWVKKYNPLYRVNMETGNLEFVAEDWKLWDLDSCINTMPAKPGYSRITSSPVQQHRLPGASAFIEDPNDYSRLPKDFVFPVIDVKI